MNRGVRTAEQIAVDYGLVPVTMDQTAYMNSDYCRVGDVESLRDCVDDKGASYKSTMAIMSYMNPYTPIKRMMFVHSTGTGKTRKSLMAAMNYSRDITIVAIHHIQMKLFQSERLSNSPIRKMFPGFNKRIDAVTCKSIVVAANRKDHARLDFYFSNRVIIVDEIHHIRDKNYARDTSTSSKSLFDTIVNILSTYTDSIIIMLTATPLVDSATEIFGISRMLRNVAIDYVDGELLTYGLSGYISKLYKKNLPMIETEIRCNMDANGEQWRLYQKHKHDYTSVHSKTSAISRFITKDDDAASELELPTSVIIDNLLSGRTYESYEDYAESVMMALRSVSVKLYHLIIQLRENRGYPHFVFDTWKKRGGIDRVLDVLTLPAIGYVNVTSEEEALDMTKGPKVLALHKLAARGNSNTLNKLIDIFNSYENRDGSLIDVMLATPKYAESMSIRTAKYSHKLSCFWNIPSKLQVDGRNNRRSSLWYETKENRVIQSFTYILYKPDGDETIESYINDQAQTKYRDISPLLKIMEAVKLENRYAVDNGVKSHNIVQYPHNTRINTNIRLNTSLLSYRKAIVDISGFLELLERYDDLYALMGAISDTDYGYVKFMSLAIQSIEKLYEMRYHNQILTDRQLRALQDTSPAFTVYNSRPAHILYFANTDTVEYQRMNRIDRRVLRVYTDTWIDVVERSVISEATTNYYHQTEVQVSKIRDRWRRYGYYICRYTLSSCYRMVQFKDTEQIVRSGYSHNIDNRKLARGEKWRHYSKAVLVNLLGRLREYNQLQCIMVYKSQHINTIFSSILQDMEKLQMIISLPL